MSNPNHIGIRNFRVFGDPSTKFQLLPITILTGENSAGKSSFIKALQILNNFKLSTSKETKYTPGGETNPNIFGDLKSIDFQSFSKTIGGFIANANNSLNDPEINFEIFGRNSILQNEADGRFLIRLGYKAENSGLFQNGNLSRLEIVDTTSGEEEEVFSLKKIDNIYSYTLNWKYFFERYQLDREKREEKDKTTIHKRLKITSAKKFAYEENKNGSSAYYFFNPNLPFLSTQFPHFSEEEIGNQYTERLLAFLEKYNINVSVQDGENFDHALNQALCPIFEETLNNIDSLQLFKHESSHHGIFTDSNSFSFEVIKAPANYAVENILYDYLINFKLSLSFNTDKNGRAAKLFFDKFILENISFLIHKATGAFQNYNFVSANRSPTERVLLISNPNEARSPTEKYFNLYLQAGKNIQEKIRQDCRLLLSKKYFDLAEDIDFKVNHDSYTGSIVIKKSGKWLNSLDEGFGLNSALAIVMMVAMSNSEITGLLNKEVREFEDPWEDQKLISVLVIEEPEMNLHPKAQSRIADILIDIHDRFKTNFIIETHSEYLIRKLQYLTAKGKVASDKTVIYYFNSPDKLPKGEEQVKAINICEDGSLTDDFGPGFFDEADKIAISIWNMNNSKRN